MYLLKLQCFILQGNCFTEVTFFITENILVLGKNLKTSRSEKYSLTGTYLQILSWSLRMTARFNTEEIRLIRWAIKS